MKSNYNPSNGNSKKYAILSERCCRAVGHTEPQDFNAIFVQLGTLRPFFKDSKLPYKQKLSVQES